MNYKRAWKYIKKYGPYIVVGSLLAKLTILYAGKVASTKDWHPFRFNSKDRKEDISEKKSKLEKTIDYYDIEK